ncbi:MAG: hypothetical protein FJ027_05120 [Candidatus Rokubacteria bacterium]|nr:hypothetical protein [Candidatus Rokubacteria bacterium]
MAFEDELRALLEANTVHQIGGTDGMVPIGSLGDYDPGFPAGEFGEYVFDRERNEVIHISEAMRRDPGAFSTSDILRDRAAGIVDNRATVTASPGPPVDRGGLLDTIRNNRDLIGLALTGGAAALGLATALGGMTRDGSGGGTLGLPNGRTLTLSPQEVQLLDMAVTQAKQQAAISAKTSAAMSEAIDANPTALKDIYGNSLATAASQTGGQRNMSAVSNNVLFNALPPAGSAATAGAPVTRTLSEQELAQIANDRNHNDTYGPEQLAPAAYYEKKFGVPAAGAGGGAAAELMQTDLMNERAMQAAQGKAALNLDDLVDIEPTDAQKVGTQVGMAADAEALRLAQGGALDPSMEALRPLGAAARDTVGRYITGVSDVPELYADENDIRTTANARLKAGLTSDEIANPAIRRQITERYEALQRQMLRDVGPGWEMSTPGQRALNDFETWKAEAIYGSNLADTSAMSAIALPRAQFIEGVQSGRASAAAPLVTAIPSLLNNTRIGNLNAYAGVGTSARAFDEGVRQNNFARNAAVAGDTGRATSRVGQIFSVGQAGAPSSASGVATITGQNPGSLALGAMGNLSSIANFQEGTANQNAITAALLEAQRRNSMMSGGGQLIGQAVSPFVSAAARSLFV